MSADDLLQLVTQILFVLVFLQVAIRAVRRPLRSNIDAALLFGVMSVIVTYTWISTALAIPPDRIVTWVVVSILMAFPYLTLRLVQDFSTVSPLLTRGA